MTERRKLKEHLGDIVYFFCILIILSFALISRCFPKKRRLLVLRHKLLISIWGYGGDLILFLVATGGGLAFGVQALFDLDLARETLDC